MGRSIAFVLLLFFSTEKIFAQQWQSFTSANSGLLSNNVFAIDVDALGIIWFGSDSGVTGYDGSNWHSYTLTDGLADHFVNDLKIMEQAELWVATHNGVSALGFSSLDAVTMATPYRTNNTGLLSNKINSLAIDRSLVRWFATDSGVTAFTGQQWITSRSPRVVLDYDVLSIGIGPDEVVYCGTAGGGVARLKLSALDVITAASTIERPWAPVPIDSVLAIHIGADSLQWFGTTQGLFQHRGINSKINWKRFTMEHGLPHPRVQAIAEDAAGKIWVGTGAGISCIEKDFSSYVNYSETDGLINDDVRDIKVASDGLIWLATAGGVSKFSPGASKVLKDQIDDVPRTIEAKIYPNPFNSSTSIEFRFSRSSQAEVAIFNLAGQRVRMLWQGLVPDMGLVLRWDGVDDRNYPVPSGMYLVNCLSEKQVMTKKLILIK